MKSFIPCLFSLLIFVVAPAFAQQTTYEVFGAASNEFLGDSLICRDSGVHVGVTTTQDGSNFNVGSVKVFDGTQAFSYPIPFPFTSTGSEHFGFAMIPFPDTNSNGIKELVISAPGDPNTPSSSRVILFEEGSTFTSSPLMSIFGTFGDNLGMSLAAIDLPPIDGIPEVVAGAPKRVSGNGGMGVVDIFNVPSGNIASRIQSESGVDAFGISLSRMQDLDGNGSDDLAIGAPGSSAGTGAVFIYSFTNAGNSTLIRTINGDANSDGLGTNVTAVGDVTGDGKEDLVIGSSSGANERGFFQLYSGADIASASEVITPLCQIAGDNAGDNLGTGVAKLGDADNNQLAEFAVSAPGAAGNLGEIRIYEFVDSKCSVVRTLTGSGANDRLGRQIGAEICPIAVPQGIALWATSLSDQNGVDSGSAAIFNPPPTATPTVTPTPTPTPTPPAPKSSKLRFRISETGEFRITVTFDAEPGSNCTSVLYGRIKVGKKLLPIFKARTQVHSDADASEREETIRILNFPRVMKIEEQKPIANLLLRTTCDNDRFDSNVFARFMNCGVPGTEVTVESWISSLQKGLEEADKVTSIRADRNVKLIKLKKRRKQR